MFYQLSEESRKVRERLQAGSPGDRIGHREMEALIGVPCRGAASKGYGIVHRNIRWCINEHGLVWRWNRETASWHCLLDADKPEELGRRQGHARRHSKHSIDISKTVNYGNLDDEQRAKVAVHSVIAAAIYQVTGPKIGRRLMSVVREPYVPEEGALLDACRKRLT